MVVLKGAPTVIGTPEGETFLSPTGNPALATGGTGDVLAGAIGAFLAQGLSPVHAAILGVYLHGAAEDDGRTILVLYTDGGDTRSTLAFGDVMTLIRASDVTIYTVGFLEHQSSSTRLLQRAQLSQIAETTGGQAFFPSAMKDVEVAYDRIVAQIRAQYSLGYISTNTTADGSWRKVEIKVRRPDGKDLRIQSRKGYFAPYRK